MNFMQRIQADWDAEAARSPEPMPCERPSYAGLIGGTLSIVLFVIIVRGLILAFGGVI